MSLLTVLFKSNCLQSFRIIKLASTVMYKTCQILRYSSSGQLFTVMRNVLVNKEKLSLSDRSCRFRQVRTVSKAVLFLNKTRVLICACIP